MYIATYWVSKKLIFFCSEPQTSADSVLYSSVRQVRKCIWTLLDEGKVLGQQACDYIETGKAHTACK